MLKPIAPRGLALVLVACALEAIGAPAVSAQIILTAKEQFTPAQQLSAEQFGQTVSLSDDGKTALVVSKKVGECGLAHIYVRPQFAWLLQQVLTLPPNTPPDTSSCIGGALSGNGTTALLIEFNSNDAWVFVRQNATWSLQQTLAPPANGEDFNYHVALSNDGDTAVIAALEENCDVGFVFVRSAGSWTPQQKLTSTEANCMGMVATHIALSGDGQIALVGTGANDCPSSSKCGTAFVFVRNESNWVQQQKLSVAQLADEGWFGEAVALSDDGQTALIGAPYKNTVGPVSTPAYVFTRTGSSWSLQQKLSVPLSGNFGVAVALSGDGNTALIGHDGYPCSLCSRVVAFARTEQSWSEFQTLEGVPMGFAGYFGAMVGALAISNSGATAFVGAPGSDPAGRAWMFTNNCYNTVLIHPDCFDLPDQWVEVGCEIIDCCPLCPLQDVLEWIIRIDGDPFETVVLRFENLGPRPSMQPRVVGNATWGPDGLLQIRGPGEVRLLGFLPFNPRQARSSSSSPRMTLARIDLPRVVPDRASAATTASRRNGAIRIRVEQRVGANSIGHSTLVYRTR